MELIGRCQCDMSVYWDKDNEETVFSCDMAPCSLKQKAQEIDPQTFPCPFCGEEDESKLRHIIIPNGDFKIWCESCGAMGPPAGTQADAQTEWNRREI